MLTNRFSSIFRFASAAATAGGGGGARPFLDKGPRAILSTVIALVVVAEIDFSRQHKCGRDIGIPQLSFVCSVILIRQSRG